MNILHDPRLCIGCRACQIACQDAHSLPAHRKIMEILEQVNSDNGMLCVHYRMRYGHSRDTAEAKPITCRRCGGCESNPNGPACVRACPFHCLSIEP